MCDIEPLEWYGLYGNDQKFKKYLSPETNAHPAKMSMRLADKIITHLEQLDLLHKGDRVIDFMAGTARTGVVAELHGYAFTGIELESHFISMIEKNKNTLKGKILRDPKWEIIQGDARHLSELLNGGVAITSPPYSQAPDRISKGNVQEGYVADTIQRTYDTSRHGNTEGQIGNLKDVGIVSPPYGEMIRQNGGPIDPNYKVGVSTLTARKYSDTSTNIGNLKDVGIVSSPYGLGEGLGHSDTPGKIIDEKSLHRRYGNSEQQIGNQTNETYLIAMERVYSESYNAGISPLVTVTKNPTKDHKLRRLDLDTAMLLEKVGYKIVDYHQAILFKTKTQQTLFGEEKTEIKGQVSFFKRLSMQKGNVAADHEDIIFAVI